MINRRNFFKTAAVAPVAAASVAKDTADSLASINIGASEMNVMDKAYGPSTLGGYAQRQSDIARRLLSEMPEWHRRQLMMEAKSNARRQIDPDIASMKSMSLSAKIQLQTDRNFEEAKQNALTLSLDDIVREKWYEQFWESE